MPTAPSNLSRTLVVLTTLLITSSAVAFGQTLRVLYNFKGGADGNRPAGSLTIDSAGNLYGATMGGGSGGQGVVFRLTQTRHGWIQTTLHAFTGGDDGGGPNGGMVFDSAGNLFGTTSYGGTNGLGTVFEISPTADGFAESVIHSFGYPDGAGPYAGLAIDGANNLYGTLDLSTGGYGAVFELSPVAGGGWTLTLVHNFQDSDGANPYGPMVIDNLGNLYGTTANGGSAGHGTVFLLTPVSTGWQDTVLHNFGDGLDGGAPFGGITLDPNGHLYGTALIGGTSVLYGTAFSFTGPQRGDFQVIHDFGSYPGDARNPSCTMALDLEGNLYCATNFGGRYGGGAILQLQPVANGLWQPVTLHSFTGNGQTGPTGDVLLDHAGNLFGAAGGGRYDAGIVYELIR
ncbi:MAG: choice-of-anchor tandem repeat GloVer-containing protein [Candidatus Sulfotelmatobacter sp.]